MCRITHVDERFARDWFDGWAVFGNSALMDVPHSHVDGRVRSGIGSVGGQCLATRLCECAVILSEGAVRCR